MELTNDVNQAQVVVIYLRRLQRVLVVDKRSSQAAGPEVMIFPQGELLLAGREIAPPLTVPIVSEIERRQAFSGDPQVMEAYFSQLAALVETKIAGARPQFGAPDLVCLGPHSGPIMLLSHNRFFKGLLRQIEEMGFPQCVAQVKARIKELYAYEMVRSETIREDMLDRLRRDFRKGDEWVTYALPEGKEE